MAKNVLISVLAVALLVAVLRPRQPAPAVDPGPAGGAVERPPWGVFDELVNAALQRPGMGGAAIGLCVLGGDGEVVFGRGERTAFIPASSLKTLTTATALEVMGPNHRIETRVLATAPVVDGVLEGDLVLLGGGDPMLSLEDLESLARELRAGGLVEVRGRVIGDGRLFGGSIFDDFWNWGDVGNGYGSGVCGLNLEHNRYSATFAQGQGTIGDPALLTRIAPEVPGVVFVNETILADAQSGDGVVIHGGERTGTVFLRGTVPANGIDLTVSGAVPDPERFAAFHLRRLVGTGGEAVGATSVGGPPAGAGAVLARHLSPPLHEIVRSIHATSDNHETECLFKLVGLHWGKAPEVAVREHWAGRGLQFEGLRMEDGSGLARADFVTPHDLARLQFLAARGEHGEIYQASLPDRDGGALRWKGGAMSSVRSYAGYAVGADGVERAFALMVNHYSDASEVAGLREAIWDALLGYGG